MIFLLNWLRFNRGIRVVEYLYGREDTLLPWVEARIEGTCFDDDAKAIGVARDDKILACVVYDEFRKGQCQMSVASDGSKRWLTRQYLVRLFAYPFLQCEMNRVYSLVSIENTRSLKLCRGLGFVQEGLLRQAGDKGQDMILLAMLRHECRFLP